MRKMRFAYVATILAAFLTAACSESPGNPTSPSAGSGSPTLTTGQLAGTWTLSSLQPAGEAAQASPAAYTISFTDGRVATRADCNLCSGTISVAGQTLTVGPNLACTRAACPTMAFESVYTGILAGDHTVEVSANALVLSSTRGRLAFTQ